MTPDRNSSRPGGRPFGVFTWAAIAHKPLHQVCKKNRQPELHHEITVKHREYNRHRQPIRGGIGSVLQEKQCISLNQYLKDELLYFALSVLY